MTNTVLETIKSRRIARTMTDEPIERTQLERVLEAGRWAPSAGNRRPHRFVAVQDPVTLRVLRMVSPGMFQRPTAAVLICIDRNETDSEEFPPRSMSVFYDVGTTAENMILAAHSMGLGSGIVTSFCKEAVRVVLNLPARLSPEMFICLGYSSDVMRPPIRSSRRITWQGLTYWERFESDS